MAGLITFMASIAVAGSSMPLKLEVTTTGATHVIEVVGESTVACTASYRLEVHENRGGNRSITSGTAAILPGKRQTVASVKLGPRSQQDAVATLDVKPCGASKYRQSWPASGS